MKRVVVLMPSQIAGKVFNKIRFDRTVKADYFLASDVDSNECKKKIKKADGIIIVDNDAFQTPTISHQVKLKPKTKKVIVLFDQVKRTVEFDGFVVISLVENENIDPNLILNILHNGTIPPKHDRTHYIKIFKKTVIKFVVPILLFLLLFILVPMLNTGKITPFWMCDYWWLPLVPGLPILWIVFACIYESACNRRDEFKREISRIEGYFRKTNPYSNSSGQHSRDQKDDGRENRESEDQPSVELMVYNLRALYRNISWGRKQAKIALVFGITLSVCGLFVYCLPLIMHNKEGNLNPDIASSVISPLVGGTIAELIAATAIVIYSRSIKQLNYYHKALHENERFLTSINIIRGLDCRENDRIAMIDKVVSDYIEGGIEEHRSTAKKEDDD